MDKDEPYEGISNDYAICFMWYAMQQQERMAVLDSSIKELQRRYNDPAERKKMSPADTSGLAEKRVEFGAAFDRALEKLDRCVSLLPWSMQPVLLRHQILMRFDQPKMAEERARKLLLLYPENNELRQMIAQALDAQGKRREAQEMMQSVPLPGTGG
jgi:predicted Zn-dependent protease